MKPAPRTKKAAANKPTKRAALAARPKKARKVAPSKRPAEKARGRTEAGTTPARRADLGAPIDAFFGKHPPPLRAILEALRKLVEDTAPEATASIKWGMPFFSIDGQPMCALAGFKSHVNLILSGPPGTFADPDGLLEGDGKTGRHLKLRTLEDLPGDAARGWLRSAMQVARKKAARG